MKELNLTNKILTIVLVCLGVLLTNNDMVFLLLSSIGIVYSVSSKRFILLLFFVFSIVVYTININFSFLYIYNICDLLLILSFTALVISTFSISQRQYIFDRTMYRLKSYKKTKKHLKNCYYDECLKRNIDKMDKYNNLVNTKFLNKQAGLKTNKDLDDIYLLYKLRFYQIYNKKNPLFPDRWKKSDTLYLLFIVTMFCMVLCIR